MKVPVLLIVGAEDHGVIELNDSAREELSSRLAARDDPTGAQFVALYLGTWEEMAQAFDYFLKGAPAPKWWTEGTPFLKKDAPAAPVQK